MAWKTVPQAFSTGCVTKSPILVGGRCCLALRRVLASYQIMPLSGAFAASEDQQQWNHQEDDGGEAEAERELIVAWKRIVPWPSGGW